MTEAKSPKVRCSFRLSEESVEQLKKLCERSDGPPVSQGWLLEKLIADATKKNKSRA